MAGVSYRQVDYWARQGLLEVATPASGSGSARRFTFEQVVDARLLGLFPPGWARLVLGLGDGRQVLAPGVEVVVDRAAVAADVRTLMSERLGS